MAMQTAQPQIPWKDNLGALQMEIYRILTPILTPEYTQAILTMECLLDYWAPAFTHKSVSEINYERFEFRGDLRLNTPFMNYLERRFSVKLNPAQGTYFLGAYMSKEYQAQLSTSLGLVNLIKYDPNVEGVTESIAEDVFEAFVGCMADVVDDKVVLGLGDIFVFNFLTYIFKDVKLSLDEVTRDPVSNLKELYDKKKWGAVNYRINISDRPNLGPTKVTVVDPQGGELGVGYGKQKKAQSLAAEDALKRLEQQGITRETADLEIIDRRKRNNPRYENEYERVRKAVERLNQMSAAAGRVKITDFKVVSAGTTKNDNITLHTYRLQLAYPGPNGQTTWREVGSYSDLDQTEAQIHVLKDFADKVKM